MAASLTSKASFHARSISLPSRPHPVAEQLEEQIRRLRSSQTASTSSSSSFSHRLSGLQNLFECVDELLLMPSNQQTLAQGCQANGIDAMLDGSLRLLDICGIARDALLQTKEHIQNIQSVLRRRCSGELSIDNEIAQYLNARKKVKKAIKICLRDTKNIDKKDETRTIANMFKDVESVTSEIFTSLLIHIAGSKAQSKRSSWSLVKKLVHQASEKEEATSVSEFEDLDAALTSLTCQKKKSGINMMQAENFRSQMENLESEIQDVDEVLESLFRHLVKTRTTLLNILSN